MSPTLGAIAQIAYVVDDVATAAQRFSARTGAGPFFLRRNIIEVAHGPAGEGTTPSGNSFAFHDTRAEFGHLVEIYEPAASIVALYAKVAAAANGWDGRRAVRDF